MRLGAFASIPVERWEFRRTPSVKALLGKANKRSGAFELESVRQWALKELIEQLKFPAPWIGTRITPLESEDVFGFSILNDLGTPFILAAAAPPGHTDKAESALRNYLRRTAHASIGIVTDGTPGGTRFIQPNRYVDTCDYIRDLDPYCDPAGGVGPQKGLFTSSTHVARRGAARDLNALQTNVESLFFEIHSHMRDIDGLHADDALDELCKVLVVKIYDERSTAEGNAYRLQRFLYGSPDELASITRALFDRAVAERRQRDSAFPQAFKDPLRLSTAAIVKVVEALQSYSITRTPTDVRGRAFQKVIGPAMRSGMGQYFTPNEVVDFLVSVIDIRKEDRVLDPFCGSAHFLTRCYERHGIPSTSLYGIEKSERMARVALMDAELADEQSINVRCSDSLMDFTNFVDLQKESFDVILTNPPFGSLLGPETLASLGRFELAPKKSTVPLEVLGLERCIQFLRPGGRLAIVLPEGLIANSRTRHIRAWVERQAKLRAIISLPIETFAPFGANVKTCVLILRKWLPGEDRDIDYELALLKIDDIGYDTTGRLTDNSDLTLASAKLREFFAGNSW